MSELWVLRHGHKLSYFPEKWKKTSRYQENPFDEPLTKYGHELAKKCAKELLKKSKDLKDGKIRHIYCSPFTRCVETAMAIIKESKHPLKLVIVYDLGESVLGRDTVYFQGDTIKFAKPDSIPYPGTKKQWKTTIDKKMTPSGLKKRYGEHIKEFIVPKKMHSVETWHDESKRMFKAIKRIANLKEPKIIVGHAHTLDLAYNYFNQPKTPISSYTFGGPESVNTLMGFRKEEKSFKMIYKPNNNFRS